MARAPLGAAVVGTSFGILTHARALRQAGIEVRALVGRDPARTAERARHEGIPHALTDLDAALALPGIDIVSIATPPHTHAAIAVAAAAAGKHVMCEKPFAANLAEAEQMRDAVQRAGVVNVIGTEFRFATGQALATRAVREGLIGEPRLATFVLMHGGLADPNSGIPAWWGREEEGGGWLGAYASHVIDQLRTTLGEWSGLSASLNNVAERDWSAEDSFTIHFRTEHGCVGVLQSTAASWGQPAFVSRICGSKGTLSIYGDTVSITDAGGERQLPVPPELVVAPPSPPDPALLVTTYDQLHSMGIDIGPYTKLFEHMRATICGEPAPAFPAPGTFADGVILQRIMDAVRRSSRQCSWEVLG